MEREREREREIERERGGIVKLATNDKIPLIGRG